MMKIVAWSGKCRQTFRRPDEASAKNLAQLIVRAGFYSRRGRDTVILHPPHTVDRVEIIKL